MIRAAILGGTGYGGMELLRYLLGHPGVQVVAVTSRSDTGPVAARYRHLTGLTDLAFEPEDDAFRAGLGARADVVLSAKPHAVSPEALPELLTAHQGLKAVDLSGDFRLRDAGLYPTWYGMEHPCPDWLDTAVYGLPECGTREAVRRARLVANPGCHASATALALWPLWKEGLIDGPVRVVSVTGSSGSGASPKPGTHHPERFGNFKAYKPLRHQHVPEIEQVLGHDVQVDFVPHSAPLARGIHVTAFVPRTAGSTSARAAFEAHYGEEPFVHVVDACPDVRAVAGTNHVHVHAEEREDLVVVTLAIDNLGKGMAGTAVQNVNLLFGLDEHMGLDRPGAGL